MSQPVNTETLKADYPVEQVIARYGVDLHPSGRTLIGRCPFHQDGGRPNLSVYPASRSWYCFRCAIGGDVISFVQRTEGLGFLEAVARLTGDAHGQHRTTIAPRQWPKPERAAAPARGPAERACLAAAVELYHNRLLTEQSALAYLDRRGITRPLLERCRVGYAAGSELAAYLRWRRLPLQAAVRVGLLGRHGREFLAGRIVVPELRAGQPVWLIGRTFEADASGPKYLGLPGKKPLMGWEAAARERAVWLTEGVFDWLTLRQWGFPAVALIGTHVRPAALQALEQFERVYLVLDSDAAGQEATATIAAALGSRAIPVTLPGVKDVAELASRPDGRAVFARAGQFDDLEQAA